jgi:trehalose utilization protein
MSPLRVTIWNEFRHERDDPRVASIYPEGIHGALAQAIESASPAAVETTLVTLGEELPDELLEATDVLVWWGHLAHEEVPDDLAERVQQHVLRGLGFVPLHASALSKPFLRLMGTTCTFRWREGEDRELVWVVAPGHPVAAGLPPVLELGPHEMYGEFFDIPAPDELVLVSAFSGGEVFRSGCCFRRGAGRIFYFSPGHETFPIYRHPDVQRVLANAVGWAARTELLPPPEPRHSPTGWFGA